MANLNADKKERIYDCPKNDSRMTVSYLIVNNDSLGGGGFGDVFLVQKENIGDQSENQQFYAMKRIKKDGIMNDKDKLHRVLTEIKIHRSLNNPYICKYEHSFEDKSSIYILMEYCENKSLDDYLKVRKTLSEYETRYYMFKVLLALQYLRRQKVIHRDLTIANIFLKDYKTIKLGDFGLSYKETENEEKQNLICGTQGYFTPESASYKYNYKTDVFDFGVCIYHLMTGNPLFKDAAASFEAVTKIGIIYDEKTKFSDEAKDLLKKIFVLENQRIDLDKIYTHDFFNEGKGLIDADFPDYFSIPKNEFEERIQNLEKKVIMTNASVIQKNKKEIKINESSPESNNDCNFGLNESIKQSSLSHNKRFYLNRNKLAASTDISNNSEEGASNKNKKVRCSLKSKKNEEENEIEISVKKKGNKKTTFLIDKKDKAIHEVNMKEKLEQNYKMLKNKNKQEDKNPSEEFKIFKLRHSTKSLDIKYYDDEEDSGHEKITFDEKSILEEKEKEKEKDDIYIGKIIDISEKYGIAYELTNKDIGILFNDFSHITKFNKIKNLVYYINKGYQKKIILPLNNEKDESLTNKIYYLGYIINEIKKKKLKYANNNINNENSKENNEDNNNNSIVSQIIDENFNRKVKKCNVYLMKYKKNNYAFFFILSNKNIQIDYFDGIKLIFMCSKNKKIIYINKHGQISTFELKNNEDFSNYKCEDPTINKKIKYAIREIKK